MKLRIYVTQSNIDNGKKNSSSHCMVADALRDAGFTHVSLDQEEISFFPFTPMEYFVDNSKTVGQRIADWEWDRPVKPFYFDVWMIDSEVVQIGEAFDMDSNTHDFDDLIGEIEAFLAGDEVMA